MAYELRPYAPGDVLAIEVQPDQRGELIEGWRDQWRTRQPKGPALSLLSDGQARICGGIEPITPWRGYFWLLASEGVGASGWGKVMRAGRQLLDESRHHRIESVANAEVGRFARFLDKLGLHREAVMRRYGAAGEDFALYAITKEAV